MYYVMRASAPSLHRESTDTVMLLLRNYNNFNACDIPQIALWLFHLLVGCGSLWVTDGIWKTVFPHCMFKVEVHVYTCVIV